MVETMQHVEDALDREADVCNMVSLNGFASRQLQSNARGCYLIVFKRVLEA